MSEDRAAPTPDKAPDIRSGGPACDPAARRREVRVAVTICTLALAGGGTAYWCTAGGIGVTSDSPVYLSAAQSLLHGEGLTIAFGHHLGEPLTHHPPLFPVLLAGLGATGLSLIEAARLLNATIFAANILLLGLLLWRATAGSWLAAFGAFVAAGDYLMFHVHIQIVTEPLFFLCLLTALWFLDRHLAGPRHALLIGAALATAFAILTRYTGVALVWAALLALLVLGRRRLAARVLDCLVFGMVACLPMAWWSLHNLTTAGTMADRQLVWHPAGRDYFLVAGRVIGQWLVPPPAADALRIAALLASGLAGAALLGGYWLTRHRRRDGSTNAASQLLCLSGLVLICAAVFMIVSFSLFDAEAHLNLRYWSMFYLAGIVMLGCLIHVILATAGIRRAWRAALILACALFALRCVLISAVLLPARWHQGGGYTAKAWRDSALIAQVRQLRPDEMICSNAPEAIWFLTGRPGVRAIPRKWSPYSARANANYDKELAGMANDLARAHGVIVYCRNQERTYLPGEAELRQALPLVDLFEFRDGIIWRIRDSSPLPHSP